MEQKVAQNILIKIPFKFYFKLETFKYLFSAYHISTILSTVANPIACLLVALLPAWFSLNSKRSFLAIFSMSLVLTGFHLALAVGSPCPVLVDSWYGTTLMVITTTVYSFFTTIIKVTDNWKYFLKFT